jgi:hypothetical protein
LLDDIDDFDDNETEEGDDLWVIIASQNPRFNEPS